MIVSVVIPTYNCAEFLWMTLESLYNQTFSHENMEIIIVNDGSLDHTDSIVDHWQEFLSIQYHRFEQNAGPQRARNYGRKLATGKYILFSDADIIFEKYAFQHYLFHLEKSPNASYAYCDFKRIGLLTEPHKAGFFDARRLKSKNYISMVSMIRANHLTVEFDESIKRLQDWDLWLNLLINHNRTGIYIPEMLFSAWSRPLGISSRLNPNTIPYEEARKIVARKYRL